MVIFFLICLGLRLYMVIGSTKQIAIKLFRDNPILDSF